MSYFYTPLLLFVAVSYFVTNLLLEVYETGVEAICLCYVQDKAMNTGSADDPYYMTEGIFKVHTTKRHILKEIVALQCSIISPPGSGEVHPPFAQGQEQGRDREAAAPGNEEGGLPHVFHRVLHHALTEN